MAYLRIILANTAILMPRNDVFVQVTPSRNCGLALLTGDFQTGFVVLVLQILAISDIVHNNRSQVTHTFLCHSQQPASVRGEFDPLNRRREIPDLDTVSSLDIP